MEAKTFADVVPASKPLTKWWKPTSYGRGKKRRAPCCIKKSVMSKRVALDHSIPGPQKHTVTLVNSGENIQSQFSNFETDDNLVLNAHRIASVYREMSVCKSCLSGELELYHSGTKSGCATYFTLTCLQCDNSKSFWSVSGRFASKLEVAPGKYVPKRNSTVYGSVLGGRLIGVSCERLSLYHACLGIPSCPASSTYSEAEAYILQAAEFVATRHMDMAKVELENLLGSNEDTQLVHAVGSFDGSYQQRSGKAGGGFSRYCFASVISSDTSKVLGYEVACNSCSVCTHHLNELNDKVVTRAEYDEWQSHHKVRCPATYSDVSSVCLESELAPIVLSQCLKRGVLFTGLVCDGDNKTFSKVNECQTYHEVGWDHEMDRFECLSHVLKRMKSHLVVEQAKVLRANRAEKKFEKNMLIRQGEKLSKVTKQLNTKYRGTVVRRTIPRDDWSTTMTIPSREICHLSDAMCGSIASYYRCAVVRYRGDVARIVDAINAIPLHLGANNENASESHRLCPFEENSWCRYQLAKRQNIPTPHHPNYLSEQSVNYIQDIFANYGYNEPDFVRKICDGRTSNNNESLHHVLFQMVKKTEQVSNTVMRLGAALAVIRFNSGYRGIRELFETLQIPVNHDLEKLFTSFDTRRSRAKLQTDIAIKKRFVKRQKRGHNRRTQNTRDGVGYKSGQFSAAQKNTNNSESEEEFSPTSETQSSSTVSEAKCVVCLTSVNERGEDIGLGVMLSPADTNEQLISCAKCDSLYHPSCINLLPNEITCKEWICMACIVGKTI